MFWPLYPASFVSICQYCDIISAESACGWQCGEQTKWMWRRNIYFVLFNRVTHNKNQTKGHLLWFDPPLVVWWYISLLWPKSQSAGLEVGVRDWTNFLVILWHRCGFRQVKGRRAARRVSPRWKLLSSLCCRTSRSLPSTMLYLRPDISGNSDVVPSISLVCRFSPLHSQQQQLFTSCRHFSASLNQSVFRLLLLQQQHNGLR